MKRHLFLVGLVSFSVAIAGCQTSSPTMTPPIVEKSPSPALAADILSNTSTLNFDSLLESRHSAPMHPRKIVDEIPILMYHSISKNPENKLCVDPEEFAKQMKHLHDAGYHTVTFENLLRWKQDRPIVIKPMVITFDDGYADNYEAYQVMKKLDMKGVVYVTSGYINTRNHLTSDQLIEMNRSGLFEFGSHTITHASVTELDPINLRKQIFDSKQKIEQWLGVPVYSFSYPYGHLDEKSEKLVKEAGYDFAVTTRPGLASMKQGAYELHRVRIPGDMSFDQFKTVFP